MNNGKIKYAIIHGNYVLKFFGDIRLTLCSNLEKFIEQMFLSPNFKHVIIDLSETSNIDSTSLGVLAKMSIESLKKFHDRPTIVSPLEGITRILLSMGFDKVFTFVMVPKKLRAQLKNLPCASTSEEEVKEKVIAAHRVLMDLSGRNRHLFSDLVKSLEDSAVEEKTEKLKKTSKLRNIKK